MKSSSQCKCQPNLRGDDVTNAVGAIEASQHSKTPLGYNWHQLK